MARPTPTLYRDHVVALYGCSHFELGRLCKERTAPLPVRIDGMILWYEDEVRDALNSCRKALDYWRRRREQSRQKFSNGQPG